MSHHDIPLALNPLLATDAELPDFETQENLERYIMAAHHNTPTPPPSRQFCTPPLKIMASSSENIPSNPAVVKDQSYWARTEDSLSQLDERIHRIAISNVRTRTEMAQPKPVFAEVACYKEWLWAQCEEEMKRISEENTKLKAEVLYLKNENEVLKKELADIKNGGDTKKEKNKEGAAGEPAGDKKKKKQVLNAEGKPFFRVQIMTRHPRR
ncbi:hypothetical protein FPQ18DRAFT_424268 [Pyronema domesticum]|nr:hypothetical protein FPQ18DRAFT_424268 [Pyronema domesticum]